jgi:hypothetical protein
MWGETADITEETGMAMTRCLRGGERTRTADFYVANVFTAPFGPALTRSLCAMTCEDADRWRASFPVVACPPADFSRTDAADFLMTA